LNILSASFSLKTSPFPITGILTAFLTSAITFQSALPLYSCSTVLA